MSVFIVNSATGLGTGDIASGRVLVDLVAVANDTGIGLAAEANGMQQVTYAPTLNGAPQQRLNNLVNTVFNPDYGAGAQQVDILLLSVPDDFVFDDGTWSAVNNGTALPPAGSGLAGDTLNPTVNCLIIYDTQVDICATSLTSGLIDLPFPSPVALYHELSHALRVVTNAQLSLLGGCNPPSPEENAAVIDENDMRTQWAAMLAEVAVLRDPNNYCAGPCPGGGGGGGGGSCCIVASMVSGSPRSAQVQRLRAIRDGFLRRTEVGFQFFDRLHYDYYAFSPQVCTMLAGNPSLGAALLAGYVEPLVAFWSFMTGRAGAGELSDHELANLFLRYAAEPGSAAERLAAVRRTRDFWEGGAAGEPLIPPALLDLLRERAWDRGHVQWALIRPLAIHMQALARHVDGAPIDEIGAELRAALDEWTARLPVDPVWASLPRELLRAELAMCEQKLLKSAAARRAFRSRLAAAFPGITAIEAMCADRRLEVLT